MPARRQPGMDGVAVGDCKPLRKVKVLWERAEAECSGGEMADENLRRESVVTRVMMRFGRITTASWQHQFSGKKDNKGENAGINSQGTVQRTTIACFPSPWCTFVSILKSNTINPEKVQVMMVRNAGNS